jgi:hypothetical protein
MHLSEIVHLLVYSTYFRLHSTVVLTASLCPKHESRVVPSLGRAREPSLLERSLKKTPPVTDIAVTPIAVAVTEVALSQQ